ncbi:MAG: hypothetical protein HKN24_11330 [Acidimicrobiales bacterium]|nr:hypothetical protein [Acidimicrobiales bacterium]
MLLVLDNCEHVLNDVNAVVRDFAMLAPGVQILATSTIALGVGGEIRWLCPVLDTADAVELLVARARSAGAILDAGDPNLAKACSMLDRLPLAIELVAPRLRAWTPEQLCARLTQHPRATGRAAPGTPERHRSMRALVEWSVQLLDEQQATLFRRLAVFRGSYDLESIVEVCGFDPLDPLDVDVLVADLVDHSLLRVRDDGGIRRYNLLRPIRDHAVGSLGEAESMELHSRLHRRLVAVFSDCSEKVHGPRQVEAMARFDLVLDDLRTILGPLSPVDARDRAELILKAGPYLLSAGYLNGPRSALLSAMEGAESDQKPGLLVLLARVESALDRPDLAVRAGKAALEALGSEVPPATRAEALLVTADPRSGELSPSQRLQMLDDAQDLAVQAGEAHLLAEILGSRQWALDDVGDPIGALASGEKAVSLSEQIGDIALHSLLLDGISHSYCTQGQNERAVSAAAEGLRLARQVGRRPLIGRLLGTHANALALVGDAAAAQDSAADALAIAIETGDSKLEGNARCYLAEAHLAGGAFDEALLVMLERSVDKNDSADPRKELMAAMITGWAATGANRPHVAIEALKLGLGFIQEVPGLRTRLAELGAVTAGLVSDYRLSARLLGMTSLFPEPGSAESAELTQVRAAALEALGQDEFDRQFALAQDLPVEVVLAELSEMVAGEVMA